MTEDKRTEILVTINLLSYIQEQGYTATKSGTTYFITPCPKCKSEKKKDDPGHFTVYPDTNSYYSHSGCCNGRNIFDYLEEVEGLTKADAIAKAEILAGVKIDFKGNYKQLETEETIKHVNGQEDTKDELINDFKVYYDNLLKQDRDPALKYLESRGINREFALKIGVLFDKHHNSVIFPVSNNHYVYRSINGEARGNGKGSKVEIYNKNLLSNDNIKEIFITEGIIDGLSLERDFISLLSVANKGKLIEEIKESIKQGRHKVEDKIFVLALDNDKAGREATEYLREELYKLKIDCREFILRQEYKDINEYLKKDPKKFKEYIEIKGYLKPYRYAATIRKLNSHKKYFT